MHRLIKLALLLSACLLAGVSSVFILNALTPPDDYGGGFNRALKPEFLSRQKTLDLIYNSYYIAGTGPKEFYLGNVTYPVGMLKVSANLQDTSAMDIRFTTPEGFVEVMLVMQVDSSHIYATETVTPAVLIGTINSKKLTRVNIEHVPFFDFPYFLTPSSFVVKSYDSALRKSIFLKKSGESPYEKTDILEKQVDGVLCTSGILLYSGLKKVFVYIYRYRNYFIVFDQNLNIVNRSHTIDTVSRAHITVEKISSENSYTFSAPPVMVNKRACIDGDRLYIHSRLRADNEMEGFNSGSVIDVYSVSDLSYKFSFYLPDVGGKELICFAVNENTLMSLHGRYLTSFRMSSQ